MQLEILRFIQSFATPALDILFVTFTLFGEQIVLAVVFCAVYWCFDKQAGRYLLYTLCASLCLNGVVKDLVRAPRPIGQPGITNSRLHTATGHSFPSGHTQSSAAFWSGLALRLRKRRYAVPAGLLVAGVGLSRLYLGVHYPPDVLSGIAFGILVSVSFHLLLEKTRRFRPLIAIGALLGILSLLLGHSADTIGAAGMLAGALLGDLFEQRRVRFVIGTAPLRALLRLGLGLGLITLCYTVPRFLLPDTASSAALRYALLSFAAAGGYPWLFTRLGI